jgi:hypothetical protein
VCVCELLIAFHTRKSTPTLLSMPIHPIHTHKHAYTHTNDSRFIHTYTHIHTCLSKAPPQVAPRLVLRSLHPFRTKFLMHTYQKISGAPPKLEESGPAPIPHSDMELAPRTGEQEMDRDKDMHVYVCMRVCTYVYVAWILYGYDASQSVEAVLINTTYLLLPNTRIHMRSHTHM